MIFTTSPGGSPGGAGRARRVPASAACLAFGLLPLLLFLLWPFSWPGNEEHYFQLAHRRFAPQDFSPYSAAFDRSQARLLFEYLLGFAVHLLGYEGAQLAARCLAAACYAAGLGIFFRALCFSLPEAWGAIGLFVLSGQTFFGGEWLFYGVESKVFAYALVFAALGCMPAERAWKGWWLLPTAATYLHFLVGGFWAPVLFAWRALRSPSPWSAARPAVYYLLCIAPLLVLLATEQFGGTGGADWNAQGAEPGSAYPGGRSLYAVRNHHHTSPFLVPGEFREDWLRGVSAVVVLLACFAKLSFSRSRGPLVRCSCLLSGYLLLALGAAYLDRDTHYLAALYLFRPASLILFLVCCATLDSLRDSGGEPAARGLRRGLCVLAGTACLGYYLAWIRPNVLAAGFPGQDRIVSWIQERVSPEEIVLIEQPSRRQPRVGLHRRLERATLVAYKFVPTHPADLHRWWWLLRVNKQYFERACSMQSDYPVAALVVFSPSALQRLRENCAGTSALFFRAGEGPTVLLLRRGDRAAAGR